MIDGGALDRIPVSFVLISHQAPLSRRSRINHWIDKEKVSAVCLSCFYFWLGNNLCRAYHCVWGEPFPQYSLDLFPGFLRGCI